MPLEEFQQGKGIADYPMVGPRERRVLGTAFYDAVYYCSTQMMQNMERGRRALILFSDGEDNSSAHHMLDAIEAAQSNDVLLFSIRYTEAKDGRLNARNKYGMSVMERIARETGGADFDGRAKGLRRVSARSASSCAPATNWPITPRTRPGDGTFHKIAIRAKRPGVTVRAKTGYFGR